MYLSKLQIQNFRSVKSLDLWFSKWKNIIVWKNNSWKSNIIKAIDIVLWESSPTYNKSENIQPQDFYTWIENIEGESKEKISDKIYIFCVLKKEADEVLNFPEINKCSWFKKSKSVLKQNQNFEIFCNSIFELDPNQYNWVDWKDKGSWVSWFQNEFNNKTEFAYLFKANILNEKIDKDIRFLYREDEHSDWHVAFSAPIRNELLQSAIIPSFRDPSNHLRLTNRTRYWKLMKALTEWHPDISKLQQAFEKVKEVSNDIFSSVQAQVKSSTLDIAFPWAEVYFQFSDDKKNELYKSAKIYLNDWVKTPLESKWSWIQSATIIWLFSYYVREINTTTSALLCVEEPELYLHPHARRVISDKLDMFTDNNKHQVIITTHSPEFIRSTDQSLNIISVNKTTDGTQTKPIKITRLKKLLTDDNYNEIFFADKVVLCENFDTYILKLISEELFPGKINANNISIIWVWWKDQFDAFTQLVHAIGLKCYILCDFDFLLRDKNSEIEKYTDEKWEKLKKRANITEIHNNFFSQSHIFWQEYITKKQEIVDLRGKIKTSHEELFYKAKKVSELTTLTTEINTMTKKLRESGVGILNWEIEDVFIDRDILPIWEKLSLWKIFDINQALNWGKKISEIIDKTAFEEFLNHLFTS